MRGAVLAILSLPFALPLWADDLSIEQSTAIVLNGEILERTTALASHPIIKRIVRYDGDLFRCIERLQPGSSPTGPVQLVRCAAMENQRADHEPADPPRPLK